MRTVVLGNTMFGKSEVVKGAPYTATEVTETTQVLADGNRIVNKTTASLARDSEGRTRQESTNRVGNLQVNGPKMVFINDPVAGTRYVFKLGQQPSGEGRLEHPRVRMRQLEENNTIQIQTAKNIASVLHGRGLEPQSEVKHESLGTQVIEGISAEGKRETRTIPAGAIGNEGPIEITNETWTSPDLHAVVLSKRNDPRFGQTVYKLTDIKRNEPDAALFQPPSGSKLNDLPPVLPPHLNDIPPVLPPH